MVMDAEKCVELLQCVQCSHHPMHSPTKKLGQSERSADQSHQCQIVSEWALLWNNLRSDESKNKIRVQEVQSRAVQRKIRSADETDQFQIVSEYTLLEQYSWTIFDMIKTIQNRFSVLSDQSRIRAHWSQSRVVQKESRVRKDQVRLLNRVGWQCIPCTWNHHKPCNTTRVTHHDAALHACNLTGVDDSLPWTSWDDWCRSGSEVSWSRPCCYENYRRADDWRPFTKQYVQCTLHQLRSHCITMMFKTSASRASSSGCRPCTSDVTSSNDQHSVRLFPLKKSHLTRRSTVHAVRTASKLEKSSIHITPSNTHTLSFMDHNAQTRCSLHNHIKRFTKWQYSHKTHWQNQFHFREKSLELGFLHAFHK